MNHVYAIADVRAIVRQRMHENAQHDDEPACGDCGAPEARLCECPQEPQEVDSDETLGLRR